jgi:ATP-binding cassette, subfamily C, bacterial LapB
LVFPLSVTQPNAPSILSQSAFLAGRTLKLPPSIILSSMVINMLALVLPLVILQVYDRVLPLASMGTLYALAASLVAVTLIEAALKFARGYLVDQKAMETAYSARQRAVRALLSAPWTQVASASADVWQRRLTAVDEATGIGKGADQTVLLDLPFVGVFLGLTWMVGGPLVWVLAGVITFFLAITVLTSRNFRESLDKRSRDEAARYNFISEALRGISTVKLMAAEPFLLRRAEEHAETAAQNSYRVILESNRFLTLGQLFASVTMIMVVTAGAYLVIEGKMSIGSLACCTLLATRTTQPILRAIGAWSQLQNATLAQQKADHVLSLDSASLSGQTEIAGGKVELAGVCVTPTPSLRLFSGLSLRVETGEIIGVTGGSGSGKSVLLALIAGHRAPDSGVVAINGLDIQSEEGEDQLRGVILLGGQPAIFRGTFLDNITLGRGGDAVQRGVRAISLIGFEEQINRLPEGFNTQLGDSATDLLPRRFIQSIALARALTAPAHIILIDGASAYFTHESQVLFRRAVEELAPRTTFILTDHRAGKLQFADRLFAIENGQLNPVRG